MMKFFKEVLLVAVIFSLAESRIDCGSVGATTLLSQLPADCTHLEGYLKINGTGDVTLDALESITEKLYADSSNVTSISAPKLTKIQGELELADNKHLKSVSFPTLTTVGDDVEIFDNPELGSLSFPALVNLNDAFVVVRCGVTQVDVPKLVDAIKNGTSVSFKGNPNLITINLQSLKPLNTKVALDNNPNLKFIKICTPTEQIYDSTTNGNQQSYNKTKPGHPVVACKSPTTGDGNGDGDGSASDGSQVAPSLAAAGLLWQWLLWQWLF